MNKTIISGRLAPTHSTGASTATTPRSATLSRNELRKIVEEMVG